MRQLFGIVVLAALLVSSCSTTYVPKNLMGGYSDRVLGAEVYSVSFDGNGYTSQQTAWNLFLTRAAEIALDNDYSGFYVLDIQDTTRDSSYVTPGYSRSYTTTNISGSYNTYGNVRGFYATSGSTTTTLYYPPQVHSITKPGYTGRILLVNKRIDGQPAPYDAGVTYRIGKDLTKQLENQNTTVTLIVVGASAVALVVAGSNH